MSISPASSAVCIRSEVSSVRAISRAGWAPWNSARNAATPSTSKAWPVAPESSPSVTLPRSSPVLVHGLPHRVRGGQRRPRVRQDGPATSVGVTDRPDRSSSGCPSSFSNCRLWALSPGWARCSRAAARVKPPSSTTATR